MKQLRLPMLLAALWALFLAVGVADDEARPPNVVLIMVDDLGYHDLGCYGHPKIKTPVLDDLARGGVRLTSFYSGATVCTPSRMALLTGAYPARLGWEKGVVGHVMPRGTGLNPKATTIAEVFGSQGYATGMSGKWHLGDEPQFRPHRQGFDSTYYINKSNNQTDELWRGDERLEKPFTNRLLTEKFTNEAVRFIQENKDRRFLFYLPYSAPHFPVEPHPDWKGKSDFGDYGDVVEELDSRIGEVVAALKSAGVYENTILVFLSDNGPEPNEQAQAKPYRGLKWSALEGGTRVPCIVHWPKAIPAGRDSDEMVTAIDLLPTLCAACEIRLDEVPRDFPVVDGVNVWSTLCGTNDGQHPREDLLYWHGMKGCHAIRVGQWKLFLDRNGAQLKDGRDAADATMPLFDLKADPAEQTDLSGEQPARVRTMKSRAEAKLADIRKRMLPLGRGGQIGEN